MQRVDMDESIKELLKYKPIYPSTSKSYCVALMVNKHNVMKIGNKRMEFIIYH